MTAQALATIEAVTLKGTTSLTENAFPDIPKYRYSEHPQLKEENTEFSDRKKWISRAIDGDYFSYIPASIVFLMLILDDSPGLAGVVAKHIPIQNMKKYAAKKTYSFQVDPDFKNLIAELQAHHIRRLS